MIYGALHPYGIKLRSQVSSTSLRRSHYVSLLLGYLKNSWVTLIVLFNRFKITDNTQQYHSF